MNTPSRSGLRVDDHRSVKTFDFKANPRALSGADAAALLARGGDGETLPARSGATTPREALTKWLDATVGDDYKAAFSFLDSESRTSAANPKRFQRLRNNAFPPLVRYFTDTVTVNEQGSTASLTVETGSNPTLDTTNGLIAPTAKLSFVTHREQGRWYVSMNDIVVTQHYPVDDAASVSASQGWLAARQQCRSTNEWTALYGNGAPDLVQRLCNGHGKLEVSATVQPYRQRADGAQLLAAFGPAIGAWARVVQVQGPTQFDLVLAPIGARWVVIAALEQRSTKGAASPIGAQQSSSQVGQG